MTILIFIYVILHIQIFFLLAHRVLGFWYTSHHLYTNKIVFFTNQFLLSLRFKLMKIFSKLPLLLNTLQRLLFSISDGDSSSSDGVSKLHGFWDFICHHKGLIIMTSIVITILLLSINGDDDLPKNDSVSNISNPNKPDDFSLGGQVVNGSYFPTEREWEFLENLINPPSVS